ncbi:hypothetical protein GGR40_003485 [Novosphingobium gossypii]
MREMSGSGVHFAQGFSQADVRRSPQAVHCVRQRKTYGFGFHHASVTKNAPAKNAENATQPAMNGKSGAQ